MKAIWWITSIGIVVLCGCRPVEKILSPIIPSNYTLKGEVFVVTQASDNKRLGRVQVGIYTTEAIAAHLALKDDEFKKNYEPRRRKLSDNLQEQLEHGLRLDEAKELADRRWGTWDQEKTQAALLAAQNHAQILRTEQERLENELSVASTGLPYFEGLPVAVASGITDSEGKYVIKVPKHKPYVIVATAQYLDKHLFWMLPVPSNDEDSFDLTLSNDNMTQIRNGRPVVSYSSK